MFPESMGVIPNIISTSGEFNGKFREKSSEMTKFSDGYAGVH